MRKLTLEEIGQFTKDEKVVGLFIKLKNQDEDAVIKFMTFNHVANNYHKDYYVVEHDNKVFLMGKDNLIPDYQIMEVYENVKDKEVNGLLEELRSSVVKEMNDYR